MPIRPDLAATLLYGIESDLAGAAGTPGELDNIALSSLTLLADPRKLYQMRYVDLPQSYYIAYASGLSNAIYLRPRADLPSGLDRVAGKARRPRRLPAAFRQGALGAGHGGARLES